MFVSAGLQKKKRKRKRKREIEKEKRKKRKRKRKRKREREKERKKREREKERKRERERERKRGRDTEEKQKSAKKKTPKEKKALRGLPSMAWKITERPLAEMAFTSAPESTSSSITSFRSPPTIGFKFEPNLYVKKAAWRGVNPPSLVVFDKMDRSGQ